MARTEAPPASAQVQLVGIGKRFRLYDRPIDRVASWAGIGGKHRDFWALRGIDLQVPEGRSLGIVGPNGAGKSTLLKIITGTLIPTEGTMHVGGRVAALLELGTGFHPEFTGRQNIAINGRLLGLEQNEIAEREAEIIAFSELGAFIDQPLRTYSSGMVVRLGFSIAASVNPRVLIVDEALSVGDARFSQKCIKRMRAFREAGTTILFVSHDPAAVTTLCDEAVLLDGGCIVGRGAPSDVLEQYGELLASQGPGNSILRVNWEKPSPAESNAAIETEESSPGRRYGSFQAILAGVDLLDANDKPCELFAPGAPLRLSIKVLFLAPVEEPTIGILIRDRLGTDVFGTNTKRLGIATGRRAPGECMHCTVDVPVNLCDGDYSLTVAVHADDSHVEGCYDWADRFAAFRVQSIGTPRGYGIASLSPAFEFAAATAGVSIDAGLLSAFPNLPSVIRPADGRVPSPFLSGFYPPERSGNGEGYAWCEAEGHLVMAPRCARLVLALGRPPGVETTVRLETHEGTNVGQAKLDDDFAVVVIDLPPGQLPDRMLLKIIAGPVYHEPASSHWPNGRQLAVAVYAITTIDKEEALPTWRELTDAS